MRELYRLTENAGRAAEAVLPEAASQAEGR